MYQNNPGLEDVVGNSLSSLSFSGVTLVFVMVVACLMWCAVPIALMLMKRRMDSLEQSVGENTHVVTNDLRRITDMLLIDRMQRTGTRAAPPVQATQTDASQPKQAQAVFVQPRSAQSATAPRRVDAA